MKVGVGVVLVHCTLFYFQYFLQLTLELVLILFITNTWILIKMAADTKSINIKNRTYYFFNDMISIEAFDSNLLKVDKKSYKNSVIHHIGYIIIREIDDYKNIYRLNPLYLIIGKVDGHIEEKNGSKYLIFDSTDENRNILEK